MFCHFVSVTYTVTKCRIHCIPPPPPPGLSISFLFPLCFLLFSLSPSCLCFLLYPSLLSCFRLPPFFFPFSFSYSPLHCFFSLPSFSFLYPFKFLIHSSSSRLHPSLPPSFIIITSSSIHLPPFFFRLPFSFFLLPSF